MVWHFNWQCGWWTSLLHCVSSAVQHYGLKIKSVKSLNRRFLYVTMRSLSFKVSNSIEKKFHTIKVLIFPSLLTHCCIEWSTQRVIYFSIRLLRAVQRKGYHIPSLLLYLPFHQYHQLAPCLHCRNPHHQAHPQQVWFHLKMAQHLLDPKAT